MAQEGLEFSPGIHILCQLVFVIELQQHGEAGAGVDDSTVFEAKLFKKNITVLTNSLDTAQVLSTAKGIRLIMVPGEFNEDIRGFNGLLTTDFIQRFRIDYLFLGANGIDAQHGLTVPDYADAETKRVLIRQSRHVIVAADHAKLGGDFFEIVARLPEIEAVVTDSGAEPSLVQELKEGGTEVILV